MVARVMTKYASMESDVWDERALCHVLCKEQAEFRSRIVEQGVKQKVTFLVSGDCGGWPKARS